MPKISICIPIHDSPKTAFFLSRLLKSVDEQTYTDYELVITKEGSMPVNTNAALSKAKGELLKILYVDDYFAHPQALQTIVDNFKDTDQWLATGCVHKSDTDEIPHSPHYPEYTQDIHTGNNRLGSPSVITLRNQGHLKFDENLSFLLDCDLYKRYYAKFGPPKLTNDLNVVIGLHAAQVSNTMPSTQKLEEFNYMRQKYV